MGAPSSEMVNLLDGSRAEIRLASEHDAAAVRRPFAEMSLENRAKRFMTGAVDVRRAAEHEIRTDAARHLALIATVGSRVVGIGSYEVTGEGVAEVAFAVADDAHGRGLGTKLLERLASAASDRGIDRLEALVLPYNRTMLEVFRDSGLRTAVTSEQGLLRVELSTKRRSEA